MMTEPNPSVAVTLTEGGVPKYQTLKRRLLGEIRSGVLPPGQLLPPETQMAQSLGVARSTMRQALTELANEGLIRRIRGKGTFISDDRQKIASRQLGVFALVLPYVNSLDRGTLYTHLYTHLIESFGQASGQAQLQLMVCTTNNDLARQGSTILGLLDKNVAGVVLVPVAFDQTPVEHIRQMQSHRIPVVLCNRGVPGATAPVVSWDWVDVGRRAAQALVEHGHRHVGFFSYQARPTVRAYEQGFREELGRHGIELNDCDVYYGPNPTTERPEDLVRDRFEQLLDDDRRPSALLCTNDELAELVYVLAIERGLVVGRDLSIISFGSPNRLTSIRRRITSIGVDGDEIGTRAAMLLQEMREGHRPIEDSETVHVPILYSTSESLGPPAV